MGGRSDGVLKIEMVPDETQGVSVGAAIELKGCSSRPGNLTLNKPVLQLPPPTRTESGLV